MFFRVSDIFRVFQYSFLFLIVFYYYFIFAVVRSYKFCSEQGELNDYLLSGDSRFRLKQS